MISTGQKNEENYTFLHFAAGNGFVEIMNELLAHPAINVNLKDNDGYTPCLHGTLQGHLSVVDVFLSVITMGAPLCGMRLAKERKGWWRASLRWQRPGRCQEQERNRQVGWQGIPHLEIAKKERPKSCL